MRVNPEIQRNLWLEFSWHRLVAMPLVLGLIFFIISEADANIIHYYILAATLMFFLIVKVWGGHKAASSVIDEVNDHTWDFQKLSALSPWNLTVGKLFGATLYAWYGGIIPFAVYAVALFYLPDAKDIGWNIALFLLTGLVVHAAALLASLIAVVTEDGRRTKARPLICLVLGLVAGGIFNSVSMMRYFMGGNGAQNSAAMPPVNWYGEPYNYTAFATIMALILLGWLVGGIYWQMRGQMKMKTGPWLWAGFLIFWGYFITGFNYPEAMPADGMPHTFTEFTRFGPLKAFGVALIGFYFIAFQEPWTGVQYRRLIEAWKSCNYAKCLVLCPRWVVTFAICLVFALGTPVPETASMLTAYTFLCFAARDIAALHFFKLSPGNRRPVQTTIFYLVIIYVLVPFLLGVLHMKSAEVFFLPTLVYPLTVDVQGVMISGALQALVMILLALFRWRRHWTAFENRSAS